MCALAATVQRAASRPSGAEAAAAELAGRRLRHFIPFVWPLVEPTATYIHNWHIDAICEHLEAVSRGEITNIIFNIPPGCMKSLTVSVMWPAWEWTREPWRRYLCASYDEKLSTRDNVNCRQIVESDLYQRYWPKVQLADDQNQKTKYETTKGGWRIATSVRGRGTGEHPHRKIIDDPHNRLQAMSDLERKVVVDWCDQTLSTRGRALNAATIVIMQRLHEEDLSGYLLDKYGDKYTLVCLPMRYEPPKMVELRDGTSHLEPRMPATPIGFQDPRTEPGELLWPGLFPENTVADLEETLGEYGSSGQLQQRPTAEGGGMFKREWFEIVDALPKDIELTYVRFWDAAATEAEPGKDPDYTVGVLLGRTPHGVYYVVDVVRDRLNSHDGDVCMLSTAKLDGFNVPILEELEPGSSGKRVIASHVRLLDGYTFDGRPPVKDKVSRARPLASQAKAGNIKLLRGPWNRDYLHEFSTFPFGKHDDQVDATSGAHHELAEGGGVLYY